MRRPSWFPRFLLLLRCLGLYVPGTLLVAGLYGLFCALLLLALPILGIWALVRRLRRARATTARAAQPEDLQRVRLGVLEGRGQADLAAGDRLLARARHGDGWDLSALTAAIGIYRQVRDTSVREGLPLLRAAAHRRLATAWWKARQAPGENFGRCIQKAIRAAKQCLAALQDASDLSRAAVTRDLGIFLYAPGPGDREHNLERALSCFESAAEAFRWIPYEYALTQHWLGAALLRRTRGVREWNLERSIQCFREVRGPGLPEAVVRNTRSLLDQAVRELWGPAAALVFGGAAGSAEPDGPGEALTPPPTFFQRPRPRAAKVLRLLAFGVTNAAVLILLLVSPERPAVWGVAGAAGTVLLLVLPGGAEVFEALFFLGIELYPRFHWELLRLWSSSEGWLSDLVLTLTTCLFRPQAAVPELRSALQRLDRQRFPLLGVLLAQLHGRLLCAFPSGEVGEGVEDAILALRSCEELLRRRSLRFVRIFHGEALARAYLRRLRGDPAWNAEQAIRLLKDQVLPLFEYIPAFLSWLPRKRTLLLLGEAYRRRGGDDRSRSRELALSHYREALDTRMPRLRQLMDRVVHRLFAAAIPQGDRAEIRRAVTFLTLWPRLTDAALWIGMADVLGELAPGGGAGGFLESAACLRTAEAELACAEKTLRATMGTSLANVRRKQIEVLLRRARIASETPDAEELYRRTCRESLREGLPEVAVGALVGLGRICHDQGRHSEAIDALTAVVATLDRMRWNLFSIERRAELLRQNAEALDRLVLSLVENERLEEAVELSERSRSRTLTDLLDLCGVLPGRVPSEALERFKRLLLEARSLEERRWLVEKAWGDDIGLRDQLARSRESLQELLPAIQESDPDFLPSTRPLGMDEIRCLAARTGSPLVLLRVTDRGSCAFLIVPEGCLQVVRNRSFTLEALDRLLLTWFGAYATYQQSRTAETRQQWYRAMEAVLEQISRELLQPIAERLEPWRGTAGMSRLVLVPNRGLAALPLHACSWQVDGVRRFLLDDFVVSYAPNLAVLARCMERDATYGGGPSLFAVSSNPVDDLPYGDWECDAICNLVGGDRPLVYRGREATRSEILRSAPEYSCIHFSCHSHYRLDFPFDSKLGLANGESLALAEIVELLKLPSAWLVALSACETGLVDFQEKADEHHGLATAFLCAGAATVWCTLWAVSDLSTALLMVKAYEGLLRNGRSKSVALRDAQIWLRDLSDAALVEELARWEASSERIAALLAPLRDQFEARGTPEHRPFSHPYFWAPFQSVGA